MYVKYLKCRHQSTNHHPYPGFGKDFDTVLEVLQEQEVFITCSEREHASFNFKCGIMQQLQKKALTKKIQTNIDQIMNV